MTLELYPNTKSVYTDLLGHVYMCTLKADRDRDKEDATINKSWELVKQQDSAEIKQGMLDLSVGSIAVVNGVVMILVPCVNNYCDTCAMRTSCVSMCSMSVCRPEERRDNNYVQWVEIEK